jgi:RND family efflux transporter MFP subunit
MLSIGYEADYRLMLCRYVNTLIFLTIGCAYAEAGESVRGFVRSLDDALIATELSARVSSMPLREGSSFRRGETLIAFDCAKFLAERRAADADRRLAQVTLDNALELERRKAIGAFEVQANREKLDKAQAALSAIEARVADCEIKAPFDGRMAEMRIRPHETSAPNQPLFRIVGTNRLEIEMLAPSLWLAWLKPDQTFTAHIEETGHDYGARVLRLSPAVDPVSQTIKVIGELTDAHSDVLSGMSVQASFLVPSR